MIKIKNISIDNNKENYSSVLAKIHSSSLTDDVLPSLGLDFLESYYKFILDEKEQEIFCLFFDNKIIGFCQLAYKSVGIMGVLFYSPKVILKLLKMIFTKPKLFYKGIMFSLFRPKKLSIFPEIAFIAIEGEFRGKGFGSRLIDEINIEVSNKKIDKVYTKTSNEIAKYIYENKYNADVIKTINIFKTKYWYLLWKTSRHID